MDLQISNDLNLVVTFRKRKNSESQFTKTDSRYTPGSSKESSTRILSRNEKRLRLTSKQKRVFFVQVIPLDVNDVVHSQGR